MELGEAIGYFVYAFASFFIIVNPVEATVVFISLTQGLDQMERRHICRRTTTVAFIMAMLFALGGEMLLGFFQITIDSLRVAGGILLFLVAVDMLRAKQPKKVTEAELRDANEREDVSVFPLATPLLTGPGAITTIIILMGAATVLAEKAIVLAAMTATFLLTYVILRSSDHINRMLGLTGILVLTRIMGLILGAISVDFVARGAFNLYIEMAGI
ncbi:MAG: NAAT family transporter [Methanotrichaceae archaeon]|nr:NAAT family transporter [Methanotrichaceae archaeon]